MLLLKEKLYVFFLHEARAGYTRLEGVALLCESKMGVIQIRFKTSCSIQNVAERCFEGK